MSVHSFQPVARTFLLAAIAVASAACETSSAKPRESGATKTERGSTLAEPAKQSLNRLLDAYEQVRAQLARDENLATTGTAQTLEREARDADAKVPKKLRPRLQQLAEAAQRMKQIPKQDASAVRRSFGRVSEALVAMIVAEPSLRAGRYVFECPMAQGYKKWVQSTPQISNPYMGKRMLECGSPSKWEK